LPSDLAPSGILPVSFRYAGKTYSSEFAKDPLGNSLWYGVTFIKSYTYMIHTYVHILVDPLPGVETNCYLVNWFSGFLVNWFAGLMVCWFTGCLVYLLNSKLINWLTGLLVDWLSGLLVEQ
jgi:hypothetical protein